MTWNQLEFIGPMIFGGLKKTHSTCYYGAEDGIRTRDPHLDVMKERSAAPA